MSTGLRANSFEEQCAYFSGKRVFVSGGAGVIGRELIPIITRAGAEVMVGDLEHRPDEWDPSVRYRQGDLNHITQREVADFAPDIFIHLAASFERSVETPGFWNEGHSNNIALSHHLMDVMARVSSLRRVVFASSYLIYDSNLYTAATPQSRPTVLDELAHVRPRNLCGSAKQHHELELEFLSDCPEYNFSHVSARIFRSYGRGSRDVISRWVRSLLAEEPIDVYGDAGCFDYVYARDVARGLVALGGSEAHGVVNLGTGKPRRVSEVLDVLRQHFPNMATRNQPTNGLFEAASASTAKLLEATGWSPQTSIEGGIAEIIDHERSQSRAKKRARLADESTSQTHGGHRIDLHPQLAVNTERKVGSERLGDAKAGAARNVLVTSLGKKIPLIRSVRRALGKFDPAARLYGADCDGEALGLHFVDAFWQCPRLEALSIDLLLDYCARNRIGFIIPTRDAELPIFAGFREVLAEAGVQVLVNEPEAVANCIDKLRFAKLLEVNGLPSIKTAQSIAELGSCEAVVVKGQFGSGSRDLHCNVSQVRAAELAETLEQPIFQPFIEGREYSVDLYRDRRGCVQGAVCRTRDCVVSGESQITTIVPSPKLKHLCERVAGVLEFWGHATLQAIELPNGQFRMLECNARFGGASTLSDEAGLDSFYWFLLEASGEDLVSRPSAKTANGLKLIRHAADYFVSPATAS